MKKLLLTLAIAFTAVLTYAQAPSTFSYQAVVRDASNDLVISSAVGTRISILQTTSAGTAVYVETHLPTTNANGLISLQIGDGTVVSGTFASIDWSNGPYFIKTETDPTGGTTYTITGTSQLLSVPYALYAETSGGSASTTLDDAYDQGGAGAGRVIDALDGTVAITGEDGIMVSGVFGNGLAVGATDGIAQGAGTRMFFNPNKAAFRAGYVDGTQWDNANIGDYSTAMGYNTKASGVLSTAMGDYTTCLLYTSDAADE